MYKHSIPTVLAALIFATHVGLTGQEGLITRPSNFAVEKTIERFERAIEARGFIVFTTIDHAAAAARFGLELRPRTVIVFGKPEAGTPLMRKAPTLAIDLPLKALVWQDDQGKVWLTYNSAEYFFEYLQSRHGILEEQASHDARKKLEDVLGEITDEATK